MSSCCSSPTAPVSTPRCRRCWQRPREVILWIAYPKLTSKLAADLNRDIIHNLAPSHGLDTVSQIAIDADWSALRFKRVEAPGR